MSKIRFMTCLIFMSLMVGCATTATLQTQLEKKLALLDSKGLVLTTVTFDNKLDNRSLLPRLFLIGKDGNNKNDKYRFGSQHLRALTEGRDFYLIILEENPGKHSFYSVRGSMVGGVFNPSFEAPMLVNYQAKENEILYIGNIHLVLRKKTSDLELRAGPVIPIFDQAAIGDATFDVEINDEYERDINEFEKVFINLKGHSVVKRILPSWSRPTSQEFKPKKTLMGFY